MHSLLLIRSAPVLEPDQVFLCQTCGEEFLATPVGECNVLWHKEKEMLEAVCPNETELEDYT